MKSTNLPPKSKSAYTNNTTRIIQMPAAGLFLRVAAILIFAGLLITTFYSGSSASIASKGDKKASAVVSRDSVPTAGASVKLAGRVSPPLKESFNPFLIPEPQSGATIATYAEDCMTPRTSFAVGETVCVKVSGIPVGSFFVRRLLLGNANSTIIQSFDITSDPQTFSFVVDATSIIGGNTVDNRGSWQAVILNPFFYYPEGSSGFTVADPQNATADVAIATSLSPSTVQAGTAVTFELELKNYGPDSSATVELTDAVPANATFVDFQQVAGPNFTCNNPAIGSMGTTTCTISSLDWPGPAASFVATYQVAAGTPVNTVIVNTAAITSTTNDQNTLNNSTSDTATVIATPVGQTCSFNCPENVVATATSPSGAIVTFASAINLNGDCGAISATPSSGSVFPIGVTTVNVASGAGPSCSFTVTVVDTPAPTISCPMDKVATDDGSGFATVFATVNDVVAPMTNPATGVTVVGRRSDDRPAVYDDDGNLITPEVIVPLTDPYPVGTTGIFWTVKDGVGRTKSCSQSITVHAVVRDTLTISCPANVTATAPSGSCQATVTVGNPTTNPADSHVTVHGVRSDGESMYDCDVNGNCTRKTPDLPFPAGDTVITWTATDDVNDSVATCTQIVHVTGTDNVAPTIQIPDNISVTTSSCSVTLDGELFVATAEDNCTESVNVARTGVPANFVFPTGTTVITYTATDASGNTASGTQSVTVHENTPPTITAPANASYQCASQVPAANPSQATASDNCGAPTVTVSEVSSGAGSTASPLVITRTFTAKDASNNMTSAVQTITVIDDTPPTITCPADILNVHTDPGICAATVNPGSATASDNCSTPTISGVRSDAQPLNALYPKGTTTITWTATDAAANHSSCVQTITVIDVEPPTISCPADIIADFDPAVNGAIVTYSTPVGTDNCPGAVTLKTAGLLSGLFPLGTTTNTFKVTDGAGLTATCSFKVTVALTSLIGLDSVSISGSGLVDSYDSTGGYPATKGALANVLSNGTITIAGSGKVFGNVRSTRVGVALTGSAQVTGNATAGTTVTKGASAIVGGTITNGALAPFMTLPSVPACTPFSSNSGITGTYSYNSSTGDLSLSGVNIATLANGTYCFHNVTLTNSGQLKVNGPVTIKMTGTLNTSGAASLPNTTLIPSNLRILSSYSGTTGVTFGNSASLQLIVYAPQTGVNISGSAPLFGTVAGKTITLGNSGMIHYDTRLKTVWPDIWTLIFGP